VQAGGFESFFYEVWNIKLIRQGFFAYYKKPVGAPPAGGWPAIICVHGVEVCLPWMGTGMG